MLQQKIKDDLKKTLKTGRNFEAGVLRMVLSSCHNREIEKKSKGLEAALNEEETMEVLLKEAKKRKEAIEIYSRAGRNELVEKENQELEIIKKYLPEQLSREQIEDIAEAAMKKTGAAGAKDIGRVMAEVMKETKGKADSSIVAEIIKNRLGS